MLACAGIVLLAGACRTVPQAPTAAPEAHAGALSLFDIATILEDGWQQLPFRGRTEYRVALAGGRAALAARGRHSASALIREVYVNIARCPTLVWSWRVDTLQHGADLRQREREDVAASVFLLFGDPGFLGNARRVPTLRYVWSNTHVAAGDVIDSPYLPGVVRSIVVRAGTADLGRWVREQRDIAADFRRAFGRPPRDNVHAVALFTDNDQTGEDVQAYYEWVQAQCQAP